MSTASTLMRFLSIKMPACRLSGLLIPYDRTVRVYEIDSETVLFNAGQELLGSAHLPGLTIPVAKIFP